MKARMQVKLGDKLVTFEDDVKNGQEFFKFSSSIPDLPWSCGNCKGTSVSPRSRTNKGYDFYEVKCGSCGWRLNYGQYKDGSGIFPKESEGWQPPYSKDDNGSQTKSDGPSPSDFGFDS